MKSQIVSVIVEMKNGTIYRVDVGAQRAQVVPLFGQGCGMKLEQLMDALDYVVRQRYKSNKANIGWV